MLIINPPNAPSVSIHAPAWGATISALSHLRNRHRFDPRPRMGSDADRLTLTAGIVSIHAPAWGATDAAPVFKFAHGVSIHAPAWGATSVAGNVIRLRVFRSTPPHGERLRVARAHWPSMFRSTPPHGERQRLARSEPEGKFRSTPPHGERQRCSRRQVRRSFDPRPRTGSDERCEDCAVGRGCFDPRPRMGSDLRSVIASPEDVSIHAPAWGATIDRPEVWYRDVSIHAPAWGATTLESGRGAVTAFRSTPPHGERR